MIEKLLEETWAEILAIRNALSDYAGKLFVKNSEGRWGVTGWKKG